MDLTIAVISGIVVMFAAAMVVQRRRLLRLREAAASHPIDRSGPSYASAGDAYLRDQIAGQLDGQSVTHQAPCVFLTRTKELLGAAVPLLQGVARRGALVAVTDRGLVLVLTRAGAFGPLLENNGVITIAREQIVRHAGTLGARIEIQLRGGGDIVLLYQRARQFSNIDTFWRDVPRILAVWSRSE